MQIPLRRAQKQKQRDSDDALFLTAEGVERLKKELARLLQEQPEAADDVFRLAQLGDFSENAEYQEAKFRLRKINDRIFSLRERLKHAKIINKTQSQTVGLGSRVTLVVDGTTKIYEIVGPAEANPSHGRISHVSPLGQRLLGHSVGDTISLQTEGGIKEYKILRIA